MASEGVIDMEMTAKEYLMQYRIAVNKVKRKQEQIEKLRADLLPSGISYDVMPCAGGNRTAADIFARLEELERELYSEIEEALDKAYMVKETIYAVEDERYRNILHDRYIAAKRWKEIAKELKHEERYIYKLHGRALEEVEKLLKNKKRQ